MKAIAVAILISGIGISLAIENKGTTSNIIGALGFLFVLFFGLLMFE